MSTCSVPNCDRNSVARKLCSSHYARWQRGLPLDTPFKLPKVRGRTCSIEGCGRKHSSGGLCCTHFNRKQAGSDLHAPIRTQFVTDDLSERLRFYAPAGPPSECWEWNGRREKDGYGVIWTEKSKARRAHVVAWELHHQRALPPGMVIRHDCDNPPCTNPNHLTMGTVADNVADRLERGRAAYNGKGWRIRTPEEVVAMRQLYADGLSMTVIARAFNVSRTTAMRIVTGKTWKQI